MRAFGKTAAEALQLWERFRRLEDAGAFAVECEVVPAAVMAEINRRRLLVTVSLGAGAEADVIFLFTTDIYGESARLPRHARAWGNLGELQRAIRDERLKALSAFRTEVASGAFPTSQQVATIPATELEIFREKLPD